MFYRQKTKSSKQCQFLFMLPNTNLYFAFHKSYIFALRNWPYYLSEIRFHTVCMRVTKANDNKRKYSTYKFSFKIFHLKNLRYESTRLYKSWDLLGRHNPCIRLVLLISCFDLFHFPNLVLL